VLFLLDFDLLVLLEEVACVEVTCVFSGAAIESITTGNNE